MEPQVIVYPPNYCYQPTYDFREGVAFDFFAYQFPLFNNIAAATGNQEQQIIIQADADFECRRIIYYASIASAAFLQSTQPIPNMTFQLTDSGVGRNLFSSPVPLASVACRGDNPFDLPWPKIFGRNSTITGQLFNFDAAVATYNIRITLLGRKIFSPGP